jgi:hypothetical protein
VFAADNGRGRKTFESRKNSKPEKCPKNAVRTHRQLHAVLAAVMPKVTCTWPEAFAIANEKQSSSFVL